MRLWSIHPRYLDSRGLVALWREALLAQKVLAGETVGYRHHPQLERFRGEADPVAAIGGYLDAVAAEAEARGYSFDRSRIRKRGACAIDVTRGQVRFEWDHLMAKLRVRDEAVFERVRRTAEPDAHPGFRVVDGDVEEWEKR